MKKLLLILVLLLPAIAFSQEGEIEKTINALIEKIKISEKGEKLIWLDSLSNVIAYDTSFENDSIIKETVDLAIKLDSINLAVYHTGNLMYYFNNIKGTPEATKQLFLTSKKYLSQTTHIESKCKFYYDAANGFFNLREFDTAIRMYDSIEIWATKANIMRYVGRAKTGKGQVYTDMGDFGRASIELQDAIKHYQTQKDTSAMIDTRNSLAILYSKNRFFKEAKKERDELIALSIKRNDPNLLPVLYFNAAADERKTKDLVARIAYLKQALEATYQSRYAEYYEPIMLSGLILAYAEADSLEQAEKHLKTLEQNKEKNTTGPYRTYYLEAKKSVEFLKENYPKAIEYGEEYIAIMKEREQYEEIEFGEKFLSEVYEAVGNKAEALQHHKNFTKIRDSIGDAQKVRVLSYYQTLYETEKRDLKIQAQESNIALLDTKNKVKNQWLLFGALGFITLFGFVWVIRSRNFAKRRQKLQENFTQDILKTQEHERSRIASELHDSIGQKLLMIKNALASKEVEIENEINLVGETIKEVREMSHSLHPFQFEKLGLITSLKNMVAAFQKNSNVFYSETIETHNSVLSKENEIYIFRMLQEAMVNVEKHAQATACNLSSQEDKTHLTFVLRDNGKGFKTHPANTSFDGLGMKTLRERALFIGASLDIQSITGKGTTITIKIPKK